MFVSLCGQFMEVASELNQDKQRMEELGPSFHVDRS